MTSQPAEPIPFKIGIFGGSFDPIHLGHLILAERYRDQAMLDQVWFIPCASQPLKDKPSSTTDRQRCEMIELAIAGNSHFHLSKIELERGGLSYTVDTLAQIRELHPQAELFLLLGEDSLGAFHQWKDPKRICELAIPLICRRPGNQSYHIKHIHPFVTETRFQEILAKQVDAPLIEISSSVIRQRIESHQSIRYLVPRSVEKYIESQSLYPASSKSKS